jgi:hypothetical protein
MSVTYPYRPYRPSGTSPKVFPIIADPSLEIPTVSNTNELPSDSLAKLDNVLGQDKTTFLDDLERSIHSYIVGTGSQCIAIVQKIPKKGSTDADPLATRYDLRKYDFDMDDLGDFVKVLFKFMTKKKHEGHELDSALTAPILDIIQQKFADLYEAHGQEISGELLHALRNNNVLLESFISRLSDAVSSNSSKMSKKAQKEIVHLLAHQTHDGVTSRTAHVIGHQIAHFSTTAVGTQVTLMAAKVLAHTLAANIGHILSKFMASAAFKNVLSSVIHKMVVQVILVAVVNFLAPIFGLSVGAGVLAFILLPIMAGSIYRQAKGFPSKLGEEVSKSVRDQLSLQFESMNEMILKDTFQKIFQGEELLATIAADKDVVEMEEFH